MTTPIPLYTIRPSAIPGAGLGMFTTRALPAGTIILREDPLFQLPVHLYRNDARPHAAVLAELLAATLTPAQHATYRTLKGGSDLQRLQRNAFETDDRQGVTLDVVYVDLSRANHSCVPNALVTIDRTGVARLRVMRNLREGEEVLIEYFGIQMSWGPAAVRRRALESGWGFECGCVGCVGDTRLADRKRVALGRVVGRMEEMGSSGYVDGEYWRLAYVRLRLVRQLGFTDEKLVRAVEVWADANEGTPLEVPLRRWEDRLKSIIGERCWEE